ncbi:sigma factor [Amycolatopsis anabasis]|uniref:sigma factor n=1 Tax=Amycolatopsis anabasis TaxID=1840409 RepID=UPI001FE7AD65|nr:sigma factor [Amycolatopsis anabasis]
MTSAARARDTERPDLSAPDAGQALIRLFDEHAMSLHRYLARRLDAATADDLVAETFLAAWRQRSGYNPIRGTARAWLFGVATNLARSQARREARGLRALAREPNRLAGALAELRVEEREVLLLVAWAELMPAVAAGVLGLPLTTVRTRLRRARRALRKHVDEGKLGTGWEIRVDTAVSALRVDVPEMSPHAYVDARARLIGAIGGVRLEREPPPRRATRFRLAAAALGATATAIVVLATGILLVDNGPGPRAPGADPATFAPQPPRPPVVPGERTPPLPGMPDRPRNAAIKLADRVSDPPQAPGQYLYTVRLATGPGSGDLRERPSTREEWVPFDRLGDWQLTVDTGEDTLVAPGGRYRPGQDGWAAAEHGQAWLDSLPRDPAKLYDQLAHEADGRPDPAAHFFLLASGVLTRPVPADLRATFYRTLSYLPWLEVDENARTGNGRAAVSLTMTDYTGAWEELQVDPGNGLVIGHRKRQPTLVRFESSIGYTVVNERGAKPA